MTKPPDVADDAAARPSGVRVNAPKCVRCGKPVEPRFRPFCSQRCSDMDLGAWVMGRYRVATDEPLGEAEIGDVPRKPDPANEA
jgi:endogenous inhibitor of DNA gyrase (YacG/DUF329 family)